MSRVDLRSDVISFYSSLVKVLGRREVARLKTDDDVVRAYSDNLGLLDEANYITEGRRDLETAFNMHLGTYVRMQNYEAATDPDYAPFRLTFN